MIGTMVVLHHEGESVVGLLLLQYVSKQYFCGCLNINCMVFSSLQ